MRMGMEVQQKLLQKLKLAPQIIQSIEILQKTTTELRQHVEEQMLENPTMELEDELRLADEPRIHDSGEGDTGEGDSGERESGERGSEESFSESYTESESSDRTLDFERASERAESGTERDTELLRDLERIEDMQQTWRDIGEFTGRSYMAGEKDKKLEAMQNTPERSQTLQDFLLSQLHADPSLTERELAIADYLVYSLDDNGYLRTSASEMDGEGILFDPASELNEDFCLGIEVSPPARPDEVEAVLHRIQLCEPPGVGARNLQECLLIQLGMDEAYALERKIIRDHLEDVVKNRLPKISKATGEPLELIDEALNFIKNLNPHPGAGFQETTREYVVPDITVNEVNGEWQVTLEDQFVPRVRISPRYLEMLRESGNDPNVQAYVRKKIEAANALIEAIEQRQQTLRKIAQEIVDFQRPFFEEGLDALRPLKMQYIADRVGVHVATVSRAIKGKYMQTPRGIFALRYFFKGGTTTDEGEELSIVAVKEKLKSLVEVEDKSSPLSDEDLARQLKDQQGLEVARRTITKYRKQLKIPSSRARRKYT